MTEDQFKALCNTFGFAPSRALRELIDCVRMQEIEECAKVCDDIGNPWALDCAFTIRARSNK